MEIGTGLLDSGLTTRQIELPAGSIGPLRSLEFRKRFPTNNPQKLYQQSGLKKNRSKN